MNQFPAFHPDWLVTFWLTNPLVRWLDPHLALAIVVGIILIVLYKNRKSSKQEAPDTDEQHFQHLLLKKTVIEKQMSELETQRKLGDISEEQYTKRIAEYKQHLDKTKMNLLQFTK